MNTLEHAAVSAAVGVGVGWTVSLAALWIWLTHNDGQWETPWLTAS